jgi:L-threonylcarbamoyladenylate synthase
MQEEINKTSEILKNDGVIILPTDTILGLSVSALSAIAFEKLRKIKNNEAQKNYILLVNNEAMLQNYVKEIPAIAYDLIDFSEKPITIVYPNAINLPPHLIAPDGSVAIRIVKNIFLEKLIQKLRHPLISTSANTNSDKSPIKWAEVKEEILSQVDYIVNLPESSQNASSTIIKLELNGEFKIIRS